MIEVGDPVTRDTVWDSDEPGGVLTQTRRTTGQQLGPVAVSHVVDFYRRYPGEVVTYFTLVEIREAQSDLTLRVTIPRWLELGDYHAPPPLAGLMPYVEVDEQARYLVWSLAGEIPAGTSYEFMAQARVLPNRWKMTVESRAVVTNANHENLAEEIVAIAIEPKGDYLHHLPELYDQDELMGRFLMLFESFWKPVGGQIDSIHNYFDPRVTPARFLPWLASWLDLELDQSWPEEKIRRLIRWAIALHRSRGTKWGVLKYLEIYTGVQAKITEGRAKNFILGSDALLGPGIALGTGNEPHTFTVRLVLPPLEAETEAERSRLEKVRRRTIHRIIEIQKPAHTVYNLELEIISQEELAARAAAQAEELAKEGKEPVDEIAAQAEIWFKLPDDPQP